MKAKIELDLAKLGLLVIQLRKDSRLFGRVSVSDMGIRWLPGAKRVGKWQSVPWADFSEAMSAHMKRKPRPPRSK